MRKVPLVFGVSVLLVLAWFALPSEKDSHGIRSTCIPKTNVFFLKTHKCASSTVQNIVMRFGHKRHLDFVLPDRDNYLGQPLPFRPYFIGDNVTTRNGKYNIFTHHTRLNVTAVRQVMYEDTPMITIVRNPVDLYESLFSYYQLQDMYNSTLSRLLDLPIEELRSILKRGDSFFLGYNQMAWDLGMPEEDFQDQEQVDKFISFVDSSFDLVMMADRMSESVILLKELMCWSYSDVVYISQNYRPDWMRTKLTAPERAKLEELNAADMKLFLHFQKRFDERVEQFGSGRMLQELKILHSHINRFLMYCDLKRLFENDISTSWDCKYAFMPEMNFTDDIRKGQQERVSGNTLR